MPTADGLASSHPQPRSWLSAARDGKVPTKITARLVDAADYLAVAPTVVRVATDAEIVMSGPDTVPDRPADPDRLNELAQRWGIESSVRRLVDALAANPKLSSWIAFGPEGPVVVTPGIDQRLRQLGYEVPAFFDKALR